MPKRRHSSSDSAKYTYGTGSANTKAVTKPRRNTEAPRSDKIDGHDVRRPPAAAEDPAAEDHIEDLAWRDQRIGREDLPGQPLYPVLHLIDLHIDTAEQHHEHGQQRGPGSAVDKQALARRIGGVFVPAAKPLADDHARRLRQAAQRADHQPLHGRGQRHGRAGVRAHAPVDRGVDVFAQAPRHLADQQRQQHSQILPSAPAHGRHAPAVRRGKRRRLPAKQEHQQEIDPLGKARRDPRAGRAHGGKAAFPEDQEVVQDRIQKRGRDARVQRQPRLFRAAERRGKHCRPGHGQIRPGEQAEVVRRRLQRLYIRRIGPHDRPGAQQAERGECPGQSEPQPEIRKKAPPNFRGRVLPQILRDHDPGHRADGGDDDRVDRGEFPRQPDGRHADGAQLPNHDLVDQTERRLQQRLQRRGDRQCTDRSEKALFFLHPGPSVRFSFIVTTGCAGRKG